MIGCIDRVDDGVDDMVHDRVDDGVDDRVHDMVHRQGG